MDHKQLVWRCRRGVRELDVLLDKYLQSDYPKLDSAGKKAFERFLETQDPIIMDWLFGRSISEDSEIMIIMNRLKAISGLKY